MSFNRVTIIGNLGRDVEVKQTDKTKIANFSVATNNKGKTTWFRVTAFGKLAEFAETYFVKGSPIYVEGELYADEWQDRDGNNRTTLEVTARDVQFLPKGQAVTGDDSNIGQPRTTGGGLHPREDDDIPF